MASAENPVFFARRPNEAEYVEQPPTPELFRPGVVFEIKPSLNEFMRQVARNFPIPWIPESESRRRSLFLEAEEQNRNNMLGGRMKWSFMGQTYPKAAVVLPPELAFLIPRTTQTAAELLPMIIVTHVNAIKGFSGYSLVQFQLRPELTGDEIFVHIDAKSAGSAPKGELEHVIQQIQSATSHLYLNSRNGKS